jgi:NAD(P)H-dependent FMN reductase
MITIIVSTNRQNSYSAKMAELISRRLDHLNVDSQVLQLSELPHDFPYVKIEGHAHDVFDTYVAEYIIPVEKFIFVIPEYNGSFPGILKAFMDSVHPRHFNGKKSALIGIASGRSGALRALDDFTGVLHYLQVDVVHDKPKFPAIEKAINHVPELVEEEASLRLDRCLQKFLRF